MLGNLGKCGKWPLKRCVSVNVSMITGSLISDANTSPPYTTHTVFGHLCTQTFRVHIASFFYCNQFNAGIYLAILFYQPGKKCTIFFQVGKKEWLG